MINLNKSIEARRRQNSVWVNDVEYIIHTEFFHWISFEQKVLGKILTHEMLVDFDYLYAWEPPEDRYAGFKELEKFYINKQPLPNPSGKQRNVRGVDWLIDSEYIRAAFLETYGIDLLTTDLHWHDFNALFSAYLSPMKDIISARYSEKQGKSDPYKESRQLWALPEIETEKQIFKMR
jgi:hypothetical protein